MSQSSKLYEIRVIRNRIYEGVFKKETGLEPPEEVIDAHIPASITPKGPSRRRQNHRQPGKKVDMDQPLDLSVIFNPPEKGSPPEVIARFSLNCDRLGLGPVEGLLTDPLTREERSNLDWYLEDYWKYPYEGVYAKLAREVEAQMPEIGKRLYKQVFEGREIVYSWRYQGTEHQISIVSNMPKILGLPWELLHDNQGYLALRNNYAIVRRVLQSELGALPTPFEPPLRVLLVTARPDNVPFIDARIIARELLDEVQKHIENGDIEADDIVLEFLRLPTLPGLRARLRDTTRPVHVLHFDGHGKFDEKSGQGTLSFEDDEGRAYAVTSEDIKQALQDSGLRLVVMTACQSAEGSVDDAFSSVATQLIQSGIDAVVAMRASLLISGATVYVEAFYRALVSNPSVFYAQSEARQAMHSDRYRNLVRRRVDEEGMRVQLYDWWVPNFYQQRPVILQPAKRRKRRRQIKTSIARLNNMPPAARYGFSERASELQKLERLLLRGKLVVVHGFSGVGKTAFVCEAADWLVKTEMFVEAHFITFRQDIGAVLATLERLSLIQAERRKEKKRILIIADGVENILPGGDNEIEPLIRNRLWDILWNLSSKETAGVVCTSSDTRFDGGRLARGKMVGYLALEGLRAADAYTLARSILESSGKKWKRPSYAELSDLLACLNYHPLALELVLPMLDELPLWKIRSDFVELLPKFADPTMTGHNRSLGTSLEYSLRRLSQEEQQMLPWLLPFEGGACKDALLEITGLSETTWDALRESLESVNLLMREQIDEKNATWFYRFHPILTPYLRSELEMAQYLWSLSGVDSKELSKRYARCYSKLADDVYQENRRDLKHVQALVLRELPNMRHALELLLRHEDFDPVSRMAASISWFLRKFNRTWEYERLQKQLKAANIVVESPADS